MKLTQKHINFAKKYGAGYCRRKNIPIEYREDLIHDGLERIVKDLKNQELSSIARLMKFGILDGLKKLNGQGKTKMNDLFVRTSGASLSYEPNYDDMIDRKAIVKRLFDSLSNKYAEVLYLYFFEGMTLLSIGNQKNLKESTICNIKNNALRLLRQTHGKAKEDTGVAGRSNQRRPTEMG